MEATQPEWSWEFYYYGWIRDTARTIPTSAESKISLNLKEYIIKVSFARINQKKMLWD